VLLKPAAHFRRDLRESGPSAEFKTDDHHFIPFLCVEVWDSLALATAECLSCQTHGHPPGVAEPVAKAPIPGKSESRAQNSLTVDLRRNSPNDCPLRARIAATLWFGVGQVRWRWFVRLIDSIHGRVNQVEPGTLTRSGPVVRR
jgi:hypothetical protein